MYQNRTIFETRISLLPSLSYPAVRGLIVLYLTTSHDEVIHSKEVLFTSTEKGKVPTETSPQNSVTNPISISCTVTKLTFRLPTDRMRHGGSRLRRPSLSPHACRLCDPTDDKSTHCRKDPFKRKCVRGSLELSKVSWNIHMPDATPAINFNPYLLHLKCLGRLRSSSTRRAGNSIGALWDSYRSSGSSLWYVPNYKLVRRYKRLLFPGAFASMYVTET